MNSLLMETSQKKFAPKVLILDFEIATATAKNMDFAIVSFFK